MKNQFKIIRITMLSIGLSLLMFFKVNAQVGIGTNTPNASAALEINSTARGILISRMTTAQRNGISSPANGLLIFNTSNNSFEVYKSLCSCWVSINDGGVSAANNLANNAPSVSNINYKGEYRIGGTANVVYTYFDSENDVEATTTIIWEIANDNQGTAKSTLSTSATPTFVTENAGKYVRAKITPRATTGLLNGIDYYGGWILIDAAIKSYATSVNVTGNTEQGSTLTGSYTFIGGTNGGTTYTENTLGSNYVWQTASSNIGLGISNMAVPNGGTAFEKTIRPTINDVNKYVRFGVQAKDNLANSSTNYVYSNWVGPITLAAEAAPVAKNVSYSPAPGTNITAVAKYTYEDANSDPEGASTYQWYSATNASGTNQTAITSATSNEFLITNVYAGTYIGVGITPKALTGNLTGTEVVYYAPTASIPAADFTIVSATQNTNNFYKNRLMSTSDYITVGINVTTAGSIKFTTNTANGYSFSADGLYSIGLHDVTLVAKGTLSAYNSSGDNFTITALGTTTKTMGLTISNVKFGQDISSLYNGITGTTLISGTTYGTGTSSPSTLTYTTGEVFSANSICLTKPISTSACVGTTITVGSNTYSITNINGQCWMTQNLKELPGGVAVNATQWLATSSGDLGYYGYYNTISPSGNSGWSLSENTANEGLLYQWSAAMMGATDERAKGICPNGWHIPSDCEFMYLEHGLGMALNEQSKTDSRSDKIDSQGTPGHKLRSVSVGTGSTNISGFSAIGVGVRVPTSGAFDYRTNGYFWTSSQSTATNAFARGSFPNDKGFFRLAYTKNWTFNVRCLKD